jgi:hypothetical protein
MFYNVKTDTGQTIKVNFDEPIDQQDWAPEGGCYAKVDSEGECINFVWYEAIEEQPKGEL